MSDYISRQAALDVAFKYCPDDDGTCSEAGTDLRNMLDELENLPSADVPEVVYCKDCQKHNVTFGFDEYKCPLLLYRGISYGHEHDYQFCVFGKKKTGITNEDKT